MNNKVRRKIAFFVAVGFCLLGLSSLLFQSENNIPNKHVYENRTMAAIHLGWQWLHAEKAKVLSVTRTDKGMLAQLSYTVVIDKSMAELNEANILRFRAFLPMCEKTPIAKGKKCSVTEEVLFVDTPEYGLMPELFVRLRPDLMPSMVEWEKLNIKK